MELILTLTTLIEKFLFFVVGIAGIGFLIGIHEFGHLVFCKLFNVSAPSFSIGFGPALWKKQIGETLYTIALIPLGGYVEIAGSEEVGQGEQKEAKRADQRSLKTKPYWQKLLIMLGGIIVNLGFAYVVLIALFALGVPKTPLLYPKNATTTIAQVKNETPAAQAGLKDGDSIISIGKTDVAQDHEALLQALRPLADQQTTITIERDGRKQKKTITLGSMQRDGKEVGMLGVVFDTKPLPARPFGQAIREGIQTTHQMMKQVFNAIKGLFTKKGMNGVGGPVMIISATITSAQKGFKIFLLLLAFISANLAVLNLLPLPILDGGQVVVYTIEALVRRELPINIKIYIHYACWIGFLLLTLYLTYKDIGRIISSFLAG